MRQIVLYLAVLLFSLPAISQKRDTVYVGGQKNQIYINNNIYNRTVHHSGGSSYRRGSRYFNLHLDTDDKFRLKWGYNALVSDYNSLSMPDEIGFLSQRFAIPQLSFEYRLGRAEIIYNFLYIDVKAELEFNNFRFKDGVSLQESEDGGVELATRIDPQLVKKSKLSTNYLNIPVTAGVKIANVEFYGGVVGGWCFNAHTKIKYIESGSTEKYKDKNLPINSFRFGYTAGIFLFNSGVGVYATYYPESIFENTPNVNQLNFGIIINKLD